jgi:hypothetical protein
MKWCLRWRRLFRSAEGRDRFLRVRIRRRSEFWGCRWRGAKGYAEAFKRGRACFGGGSFGGGASFDCAVFGDWAQFDGAVFGDFANFDGAAFDDGASFAGAAFGNGTRFACAAFGSGPSFTGAAFSDGTDFSRALFRGGAEFSGLPYEKWFMAFMPRAALGHPHRGSKPLYGSGPDRFLTISFLHARFYGEADFSGRSFEQAANFTDARFYYPPDFDAAANVHRIDFTGAYIRFVPPGKLIHWTEDSHIPIRLRAFRKIVEDTKNHDLERDLYIEERKAERGVYWHQLVEELTKAPEELKKKLEDIDKQQREVWSNWRHRARARNAHRRGIVVKVARLFARVPWLVVMFFYLALAGYGRSFAWPALWLV